MSKKRKRIIGIYKITNKINGNSYIGQSKDMIKRWQTHKRDYEKQHLYSYKYPIYRAFRKYGIDNFTFEILEECLADDLNEKEKYWITYYDTFFNGYNQTLGGECRKNIPKENIIGIFHDLETTSMLQKEIAKKWNVSDNLVNGINTGRYWRQDDRKYPIQVYIPKKREPIKKKNKHSNKKNQCAICGALILENSTICVECFKKEQSRKIPPKDVLLELIIKYPFTQIAKKYGVSDNAIRKWCKKYGLPTKRSELDKMRKESGIERNKNQLMNTSGRDRKYLKSVVQYDLTGSCIKTHDSARIAAEEVFKLKKYDCDISTIADAIRNCCRGKQKTAYGYVWLYV